MNHWYYQGYNNKIGKFLSPRSLNGVNYIRGCFKECQECQECQEYLANFCKPGHSIAKKLNKLSWTFFPSQNVQSSSRGIQKENLCKVEDKDDWNSSTLHESSFDQLEHKGRQQKQHHGTIDDIGAFLLPQTDTTLELRQSVFPHFDPEKPQQGVYAQHNPCASVNKHRLGNRRVPGARVWNKISFSFELMFNSIMTGAKRNSLDENSGELYRQFSISKSKDGQDWRIFPNCSAILIGD